MEERDRDLEQSEQKALLVLFFFSGVSSLVYQVVWARMLTVVFGTTLLATSTVLSAFMAGLALGSYVLGRYIDRCKHPLRIFAALEVGIGLFALFFPTISANLGNAYGALVGWGGTGELLSLFLGPLRPLLRPPPDPHGTDGGHPAGHGQICGAAAGQIRRSGRPTLRSQHAGRGRRGVGGDLWVDRRAGFAGDDASHRGGEFLGRGRGLAVGGATSCRASDEGAIEKTAHSDRVLWGVLAGFALSGFAALGYEVAWMRLLMVSFSFNSHYEFSIVLVAFLSGLALGGWLGSRLLTRRTDLLSIFVGVQFLIGACGALSVLAFAHLSVLVEPIQRADSWWVSRTGVFFTAVSIMLLPTVAMGVIFPLVGQIYTRQLARLGRGIGDIGAVNSLGAVGGAFVTGFVLIPLLGTEWSVKVLATLNGLVGLTIALVSQQRKRLVWCGAAGVALLLVLVPSDVLRRIAEPTAVNRELVFYQEGAEGVITVEQQTDGFRKMALNGGGQVPTDYSSLQIFRLLGHLPLLLHPDPQEVLVVSLGGGIALGGAAQYEPRRITCVELVPEVIDAARLHFGEFNHHVLENPTAWNIDLVIDDGRNFLLSSRDTYQIITGDATHPTSADSWVLYTKEFYELCRAHLSADGIMAQWLPFHGLPPDDYQTIVRTFQHVFPHATLWRSNNYSIMVGTMQPQAIDWERLNEKMTPPRVHRSLEGIDLGNAFALLNTLVMDEEALRRYVGEGPLNTDDHPYISFVSPKGYSSGSWEVLEHLAPYRTSALSLLTAPSATVRETIEAYFKAGEYALEGDIMRLQNRDRAAVRAYQRALQANPEDRSSAYFLDLLAEQLLRIRN